MHPGIVVIRTWRHEGVYCLIAWGLYSFNGYVQLPPGLPALEWARTAGQLMREEHADRGFEVPGPIGYDALPEFRCVRVLTYGPDDAGWIGFDTAHALDNWTNDEIRRWLEPVAPVAWLLFLAQQDQMGPDRWPPGRILRNYYSPAGVDDVRDWTMVDLVDVVNDLAGQVAELVRDADAARLATIDLTDCQEDP